MPVSACYHNLFVQKLNVKICYSEELGYLVGVVTRLFAWMLEELWFDSHQSLDLFLLQSVRTGSGAT